MRPDKNNMPSTALWAVLAIPVIWFGLLCGGAAAPGRTAAEWFDAFTLSMKDPLRITITEYSVKAVLIILLVYLLCVFLFIDSQGKRRPGEEHGSAKWGKARSVCAKYRYQTQFMERLKARISKIAAFFRSLPVRLHIKRPTPEEQERMQVEKAFVENADPGCGLMKFGGAFIPFVNDFPKNTKLYKLMTTKPGEWQ